MIILCTFTLISGILVHPLNRGLSAIFDKPVAKKVQKIEKKDPEADWITVTDKYFLSNYYPAKILSLIVFIVLIVTLVLSIVFMFNKNKLEQFLQLKKVSLND